MVSLHIKQQEHLAITVSTVVIYRYRPKLARKGFSATDQPDN
jgi:hypothetical protein